MIDILIVEDQPIFSDGLLHHIQQRKDMRITHSAKSIKEALACIREEIPTVMVLDLGLPDGSGLDLLEQLKSLDISIKVLVLSMQPAIIYERLLVGKNGVLAYLEKSADRDTVVETILGVAQGLKVFRIPEQNCEPSIHLLTPMQLTVAHKLHEGYRAKEIAKEFGISEPMVARHKKNAMTQINAVSERDLFTFIRIMGL